MFNCNIFYLNNVNHKFMITLFDCNLERLQQNLNNLENQGYKISNVIYI